MKRILLALVLMVATFSLSACGEKNYTVDSFKSEGEVASSGFHKLNQVDEKYGTPYIDPKNTFVVYYKDGVFTSAFISQGTTMRIDAINGNVYITNNENSYFYNKDSCLINNQEQPLTSDTCKNANIPAKNYNTFIKDNFSSILK